MAVEEMGFRTLIRKMVREELESIVSEEFARTLNMPSTIIPIEPETFDLNTQVSRAMRNLGIPVNIKGHKYIRSAIIMGVKNPHVVENITKELYEELAVQYDTTPTRVERAIRHAIESSWNSFNREGILQFFKRKEIAMKNKPTNKEFISTIMDKFRLELKLL